MDIACPICYDDLSIFEFGDDRNFCKVIVTRCPICRYDISTPISRNELYLVESNFIHRKKVEELLETYIKNRVTKNIMEALEKETRPCQESERSAELIKGKT